MDLGSPVILALNKIDRFIGQELELVRERLGERVGEGVEVVPVQCGGVEVTRIYHDGRGKPPCASASHRSRSCAAPCNAISTPTRKFWTAYAIPRCSCWSSRSWMRRLPNIGADGPMKSSGLFSQGGVWRAGGGRAGTDVLIQGYLGIRLLKELCALYEVPVREVDMQRFLDLAGNQVKRSFKPAAGAGRQHVQGVSGDGDGGGRHVARRGLWIDIRKPGKAVARSLESRGDLVSGPTCGCSRMT